MAYDGVGCALAANTPFAGSHHLTSHGLLKVIVGTLKGQTVATVEGPAAAPGLMLMGLLQHDGLSSNWLTDLSVSGAHVGARQDIHHHISLPRNDMPQGPQVTSAPCHKHHMCHCDRNPPYSVVVDLSR